MPFDASGKPRVDVVRAYLERIRSSSVFASSDRLFALLQFVVEETLEGRGNGLKELVIGQALYGEDEPYDPKQTSTVRVEARRLRRKLAEYYSDMLCDDPIQIDLPIGSYAPTIAPRVVIRFCPGQWTCPARIDESLLIAILPLRAPSGDDEAGWFASGLTDELMYAAQQIDRLRLASRLLVYRIGERQMPIAEAAAELHADAILHGTVRKSAGQYRIDMELTDARGVVTWFKRVDCDAVDSFQGQEDIAQNIVASLRDARGCFILNSTTDGASGGCKC